MSCLFENGKSYTAEQIARLLGPNANKARAVRWARDMILSEGCYCTRIGQKSVTTGDLLNQWIESRAMPFEDHFPNRSNDR